MTRAVALIALSLLSGEVAPAAAGVTGYASAYAPGVMEDVIRWRLDTGTWRTPPRFDWYQAHGAIATNNCAQVGQMATVIDPAGRAYRVLVADCGGREEGGGAAWMTRNRIVAELDWRLWTRLTDEHGKPLEVTIR